MPRRVHAFETLWLREAKWSKCPHPRHFSLHYGGRSTVLLDKVAHARGERVPTSKGRRLLARSP